jgi:uncharacterized protein YndB with AHSA1/START domain
MMEIESRTETTKESDTNRIEKRVTLRAPRSRVWRAIANADEFGKWFGVKMEDSFAEGATARGKITHQGFDNMQLEIFVERIVPETFFSYRWHPYAIDPKSDYSGEPTTLVEFRLDETEDGTVLTIVESGFDRVPLARRAEAFRMNEHGWTSQVKNIERYVTQS